MVSILRNCQTVVQTDYRVFQALLAMHEALLCYVKLVIVLDCSYCVFCLFSPVSDNVEPLAMSLLGICISSLRKFLFKSFIYLCLFSVTLHRNFYSIQMIMNTFSHSIYRLSFHLIQPPTLDT